MLFRSNDTATTEIYTRKATLSLHDALPISAPLEPAAGPYRYFRNPMYTVGNLQLWGLALGVASFPGLGAALFDHVAILVFNQVVEQPHVNRRYRAAVQR